MTSPPRKLTVETIGGATLVHFVGRTILRETEVQKLEEEFLELAGEPQTRIVLSFKGVESLSSSALTAFIKLYKRVRTGGGTMRLCNISPKILEVFLITGVNKLFQIYNSEIEALASF